MPLRMREFYNQYKPTPERVINVLTMIIVATFVTVLGILVLVEKGEPISLGPYDGPQRIMNSVEPDTGAMPVIRLQQDEIVVYGSRCVNREVSILKVRSFTRVDVDPPVVVSGGTHVEENVKPNDCAPEAYPVRKPASLSEGVWVIDGIDIVVALDGALQVWRSEPFRVVE